MDFSAPSGIGPAQQQNPAVADHHQVDADPELGSLLVLVHLSALRLGAGSSAASTSPVPTTLRGSSRQGGQLCHNGGLYFVRFAPVGIEVPGGDVGGCVGVEVLLRPHDHIGPGRAPVGLLEAAPAARGQLIGAGV